MFPKFRERLQAQTQSILNDRMAKINAMSGGNATMDCTVRENIVQRYAVWFGGSVLGAHPGFPSVVKTREMYMEEGPSICRHNAISSGHQ